MARMRITLVLLLALAAGGGLAYGTYSYMQNVQVKTVSLPTRPVVVAAADLELGAELRADDLRVVEWPESASRIDGTSTRPSYSARPTMAPAQPAAWTASTSSTDDTPPDA